MSSVATNIPGAPTTDIVSATMLSYMAAQTGVLTDYEDGSQIRTLSESIGSVVEMESVIANALAVQAAVNSAYTVFNIVPYGATYSVGNATISTGTGTSPPPASQNVTIPQGTAIQTGGGIQFQTSQAATLLSGTTSVSIPIIALSPGVAGNVPANTITSFVYALPYPLYVNNPLATTGGTSAELPSQTLARFTAKVLSLGLGTPVSIANACIGVSVPSTGETVMFSTVYEPWITTPASGAQFAVYIDNGSGSASTSLISAVQNTLNGSFALNLSGYRPAGVPYSTNAVTPLYCSVAISGTATIPSQATTLQTLVSTNVQAFMDGFNFGIGTSVPDIIGTVANVAIGQLTAINVVLYDSTGTAVQTLSPSGYQRIVTTSISVTIAT